MPDRDSGPHSATRRPSSGTEHRIRHGERLSEELRKSFDANSKAMHAKEIAEERREADRRVAMTKLENEVSGLRHEVGDIDTRVARVETLALQSPPVVTAPLPVVDESVRDERKARTGMWVAIASLATGALGYLASML